MIYPHVKIELCLHDHRGSREDRLWRYMTIELCLHDHRGSREDRLWRYMTIYPVQ